MRAFFEKQIMTIRPASETDHDAIWSMLEPVFRAGTTYAIDPDISREAALSYWLSEHAYVATRNDEPRGTFYIRTNQQGGGSHVCNCGYITARGAEGQGIAREMLSYSLEEAKRLGFEAMQYNFVLANNTRAAATWERAGFQIVGRQPRAFRMPNGEYVDALMMHKPL